MCGWQALRKKVNKEDKLARKIFLSACEASADVHCGHLIESVRKLDRDISFVGVGGEKMSEAGCEMIENTVDRAVMGYKAFAEVGYFVGVLGKIKKYLKNNKVDLVVVCDSPSFNFHVARIAKKLGIPVLFYVAPQLWAWAAWRIKKVRKYCDKLACILPFEKEWFGSRGVEAEFVGNPLYGELSVGELEGFVKKYENFDADSAKVALIPGSRKSEIESIWGAMQEIAVKLKADYPGISFTTVAVDEKAKDALVEKHIDGFDCDYSIRTVKETARASDMSLVMSGSATLEVASAGCPMIVMYQTNRFMWAILGWIVKSKFLCLVNIIAGRELIPEYMPYFKSAEPIYETARKMLGDAGGMRKLSAELIELVKPLASKDANEETAKLVLNLLS